MREPDRIRLVEEAADLFARLQSEPQDPHLGRRRDDFLARGADARAAYASVAKAWSGTARRRRAPPTALMLLIAAIAGAAAMGYAPVRRYLLADISTRYAPVTVAVASGDQVALDASSALIDETDGAERRVVLLDGAALFSVSAADRPFAVSVGDAAVRVVGTVFETTRIGDAIAVSVIEGAVEVAIDDRQWALNAGDRLRWTDDGGARIEAVDVDDVAAWRRDRYVADGAAFEDVARVIDRRSPGAVLVFGEALAAAPVAGSIDLTRPQAALDALAAALDARVVALPFLTVITPN